jgi:hypothetical protein
MKTGVSWIGELVTGLPYLQQRLTDAVLTPLGAMVGARSFGSNWYRLQDRNVDGDFYMDAYVTLSETIHNPVNGLDDFRLETMSINIVSAKHVEVAFTGLLLNNGEPITVDNLVITV